MVKFGLLHRSAMNVRAVPPCAGEDARTTAGETPALRSSARPRHRDQVQLLPTTAETPALRSSAESYGHSGSRRHMRTCGRRLLTRDAAAHCIQIQAAFFRDFDCRANTFASKRWRSEEHTSELQSRFDLVCRLLLEKKKN